MARTDMVILEEDYARLKPILDGLRDQANAKFVFLIDRNGQQIATSGQLQDVDATALASLTAGSVAATEGLAQLTGEDDFSALLHEGKNDSIHVTLVGGRTVLLLVFDENSSVGLVRLRVDQHVPELTAAVNAIVERVRSPARRTATPQAQPDIPEITAEDIDALFG